MNKKLLIVIVSVATILVAILAIRLLARQDKGCDGLVRPYLAWPQTDVCPLPPVSDQDQDQDPTPIAEANIRLDSPVAGTEGQGLIKFTGQARVFENMLQVRVRDNSGRVLAESPVYASSSDMGLFGPFNKELSYSLPDSASGWAEAFVYSAKDGSEIDKVSVPVVFRQEKTTVKLFFNHPEADPAQLDCTKLRSVDREVVKVPAIGRSTILALLEGPSAVERTSGYSSSINEGTALNSLSIQDGVARADFSERLNEGMAGSCLVTAVRAQIEQTLLQFPTIKKVIISVNGREDDILQP
jgi:Immunoglobulin-like domain of bacterial spore germination/Sporulation and spore germination